MVWKKDHENTDYSSQDALTWTHENQDCKAKTDQDHQMIQETVCLSRRVPTYN